MSKSSLWESKTESFSSQDQVETKTIKNSQFFKQYFSNFGNALDYNIRYPLKLYSFSISAFKKSFGSIT